MSLDDPVVITCSISGAIANREQCPAIPYTPAEYAAEARRIVDEGGVMIHIHARKPDGRSTHARRARRSAGRWRCPRTRKSSGRGSGMESFPYDPFRWPYNHGYTPVLKRHKVRSTYEPR